MFKKLKSDLLNPEYRKISIIELGNMYKQCAKESFVRYAVRNISLSIHLEHGKRLSQVADSIKRRNSLPIFGTRLHHTIIKQISIAEAW